jgi:hypothetical protein
MIHVLFIGVYNLLSEGATLLDDYKCIEITFGHLFMNERQKYGLAFGTRAKIVKP